METALRRHFIDDTYDRELLLLKHIHKNGHGTIGATRDASQHIGERDVLSGGRTIHGA